MEWLKNELMREFNMKDLEEAKKIIGWEITREKGILKIDQKRYIRDLLESEGIILCYTTVLPVKAGSTLFLDQAEDHQQVDLTEYWRLVDKLIYLSYGTRPDIAFVIGQLNCHNSDLQAEHLRIAKQVLQYLKKTITLGIKWDRDLAGHQLGGKYGKFGVVGYVDSSYNGELDNRKLITWYYFFFREGIVIWYSKWQ